MFLNYFDELLLLKIHLCLFQYIIVNNFFFLPVQIALICLSQAVLRVECTL